MFYAQATSNLNLDSYVYLFWEEVALGMGNFSGKVVLFTINLEIGPRSLFQAMRDEMT